MNATNPRSFYLVYLARKGDRGGVDAILPALEALARNPQGLSHLHHAQYNIGVAQALSGRRREALEWLRKAAAEGFPCYPLFAKDPDLAGMAGDPDFEALLAQLKAQSERLKGDARMVR